MERVSELVAASLDAGIRKTYRPDIRAFDYDGVALVPCGPYWTLCVGNPAWNVAHQRGPEYRWMPWRQGWIDFHPVLLQEQSRLPLASHILRKLKEETNRLSGQEEAAILEEAAATLRTGNLLIPYLFRGLYWKDSPIKTYFREALPAYRTACYLAKKAGTPPLPNLTDLDHAALDAGITRTETGYEGLILLYRHAELFLVHGHVALKSGCYAPGYIKYYPIYPYTDRWFSLRQWIMDRLKYHAYPDDRRNAWYQKMVHGKVAFPFVVEKLDLRVRTGRFTDQTWTFLDTLKLAEKLLCQAFGWTSWTSWSEDQDRVRTSAEPGSFC